MGKVGKSKLRDYYKEFEEIYTELLEEQKKQYHEIVDKARDFESAHNLYNETIQRPKMEALSIKMRDLGTIGNFFAEAEEVYKLDKTKDRPQIFNDKLSLIDKGKINQTVQLLAEFHANWLMFGYWGKQSRKFSKLHNDEKQSLEEVIPLSIAWKGDNETELVQLIYALHEAGYIEHESKEITKLVEDFAYIFDFPLGKNWQVNLSTSIHKRNADYTPKIFDNLKEAYQRFQLRKIDKKKKN